MNDSGGSPQNHSNGVCEVSSDGGGGDVDVVSDDGGVDEDDDMDIDDMRLIMDDANF